MIGIGSGATQKSRVVFVQAHRGYAFPLNFLVGTRKKCADSRLLFLAKFLENRIRAQRVPDWIEP